MYMWLHLMRQKRKQNAQKLPRLARGRRVLRGGEGVVAASQLDKARAEADEVVTVQVEHNTKKLKEVAAVSNKRLASLERTMAKKLKEAWQKPLSSVGGLLKQSFPGLF